MISTDGEPFANYAIGSDEGSNELVYVDLEAGNSYLLTLQATCELSCIMWISDEENLFVEKEWDTAYYDVHPGEPVIMTVNARAEYGALSYEWGKSDSEGNWTVLEEETGSVLELSEATKTCQYQCTVRDVFGSEIRTWFSISIDNGFSAYQANHEAVKAVRVGDAATLSVEAQADVGGITYAWFLQEDDGEEVSLPENGPTLTVNNVTEPMRFLCVVKDSFDNGIWLDFTVAIENHFVAYPRGGTENDSFLNVEIRPGQESVELEVIASADEGDLHYSWRDETTYTELENNSSRLTVLDPAYSGNWIDYSCRVSDDWGNRKEILFRFYVETGLTAYVKGTTSQYQRLQIPAGGSTVLELDASVDIGGLRYEWTDTAGNAVGSEASLTVGPILQHQVYSCFVYDDYGNSRYVSFDIGVETGLDVHPKGNNNLSVSPGQSVTMETEATVSPGYTGALHYQWYEYVSNVGPVELAGKTGPGLTISGVSSSASYSCRVTDDYGNTGECYFTIHIENHLRAYVKGSGSSYDAVSVEQNMPAVLTVEAAADIGEIHYQWFCRDFDSYDAVPLENETGSTLILDRVTKAAQYECHVADDYGNLRIVTFNVSLEKHFRVTADGTNASSKELLVRPGSDITMKVNASVDEGSLRYQWSEGYSGIIPGAAGPEYKVSNIRQSTYFTCMVEDDFGHRASVYFDITIDNGFYARDRETKKNYVERDVPFGSAETLTVEAGADVGGLHYAWFADGEPLPAETGPSLVTESIRTSERYLCRVTDDYGSMSEVYYQLSVQNHLEAWPKGHPGSFDTDIGVEPNGSVTLEAEATATQGPITYQWSCIIDGQETIMDDMTDSSITVSGITGPRTYYCLVSDRYNNRVNLRFSVYVENHMRAWCGSTGTTVENVYVEYGKTAVLQAVAAADRGSIRYRWTDSYGTSIAETASVTTSPVTAFDSYYCSVSDAYGNTAFLEFNVHVRNDLAVTATTPAVQPVPVGGSAAFGVKATAAAGPLRYDWYGIAYEDVTGLNTATLKVDNIRESGTLYCAVSDMYGNSKTVHFTVNIENHFKACVTGVSPETDYAVVLVNRGESPTLGVTATADQGGFTYAWSRYRYDGVRYSRDSFEDHSASVVVENVNSAWQYQCVVTDIYHTTRQVVFQVGVQNHLTAVDHETGRAEVIKTVKPGETLTLAVDAAADEADSLKWTWVLQQDGTSYEVKNAQGNRCTTVSLNKSCVYFCQVTDQYGFSTTVRYELNVPEKEEAAFRTTLSMEGFTGINVFVKLPEGEKAADYTVRTVPHNSMYPYAGQEVSLGSITPNASGEYRIGDIMKAASTEMTDTVEVILLKNGTEVKREEYSVNGIVQERLASGELNEVRDRLNRALIQYGFFAQLRFDHKVDDIPRVEGAPALTPIPASYAAKGDPTGFEAYIANFEAKIEMADAVKMNVYLTPAAGYGIKDFEISMTCAGAVHPVMSAPVMRSGKIFVQISGLLSYEMDKDVRITVKLKNSPSTSAVWTRSLITCAYENYQAAATDARRNLMMSLYQYFLAAKDRFLP